MPDPDDNTQCIANICGDGWAIGLASLQMTNVTTATMTTTMAATRCNIEEGRVLPRCEGQMSLVLRASAIVRNAATVDWTR